MATITISAPASRRTVVEGRRVAVGGTPAPSGTAAADRAAGRAGSLRLTRRGRRLARTVVVLMALLAALVLSLASHNVSSQAGDGPAVPATTTVVVQPGQTLWSVARGLSRDVDIRETVARIQELNNLSGTAAGTVRPGQALVVPVLG